MTHRRLMLCGALAIALSSCADTKRIAVNLTPPPQFLVCDGVPGGRPSLPPAVGIDWKKVATIPQAKIEYGKAVSAQNDREGVIADYILNLEAANFQCRNNMIALKDWFKATAAP